MKRTALVLTLLVLALLALSAGRGGLAAAQGAQQSFSVNWWTVDGGGGASGGGYTLGGAAGQPDAGAMTNGPYTLRGGFWIGGGPAAAGYGVYLPVVCK